MTAADNAIKFQCLVTRFIKLTFDVAQIHIFFMYIYVSETFTTWPLTCVEQHSVRVLDSSEFSSSFLSYVRALY